jgi:hypothetical protein
MEPGIKKFHNFEKLWFNDELFSSKYFSPDMQWKYYLLLNKEIHEE